MEGKCQGKEFGHGFRDVQLKYIFTNIILYFDGILVTLATV